MHDRDVNHVTDGTDRSDVTDALPRPAVDVSRKLYIGHFAFMRAVVQGMDPAGAWDRF